MTRSEQLSPRLTEYGFTTPSLSGETNVRVLLPEGYASHPRKRYPVLLLLHGCCDFDVPGSRAWTVHGEAERITAGMPLIVVMPDGGKGGFYTDWFNAGAGGGPDWETYHLQELLPWVDEQFRTVGGRDGRIVDGLSMGGFGATHYAARHPDMFVSAASFSGALDSNDSNGTTHSTIAALDLTGLGPLGPWGDRLTQEVRWRGSNPVDLAVNLRPVDYTLRTGNGDPGPLDSGGAGDPVERTVHGETVTMHRRLNELGIAHVFDDYGPGTHTWPYWARSLEQTLPHQLALLRNPPPPPRHVTYRTIEPRYDVFDWHVAIDRPALEFSSLRAAGRRGFVLRGSGTATVRTPAAYRPGGRRVVQVGDAPAQTLTADGDGRLQITVPLGAGNGGQQYRPGTTTTVHVARVRITRPNIAAE